MKAARFGVTSVAFFAFALFLGLVAEAHEPIRYYEGGNGGKWQRNTSVNYSFGNTYPGGEWRDRVRDGRQQWNNVGTPLQFVEQPDITPYAWQFCLSTRPYQENEVVLDVIDGPGNNVGITAECTDATNNEMLTFAIVFDSRDTWYTGNGAPAGDQFDLFSVASHEFGHASGWGFHYDDAQTDPAEPGCVENGNKYTMCRTTAPGTNYKRSLEGNDTHTLRYAYPTWESLGGGVVDAPDAASWGSGRMDAFVRGTDNQLWHRWYSGGWSSWEGLGGTLASGPGATARGSNFLDVFVRGTDNQLHHKWWNGSSWNGYEALGGGLVGAPDASGWTNRVDAFVRGTDDHLHHKWYDGSWHDWEDLGGVLTSDPATVSWGANRIDVFARGTDNGLWHKYWNGVAWIGWEPLGGSLASEPDVSSWGVNRLDVYARRSDGRLIHKLYDGVAWSGWEVLNGGISSGPGAASWGSGAIDSFARGNGGDLQHTWRRP
jgi:repeat uncharacterized protein DUF346/matrixin